MVQARKAENTQNKETDEHEKEHIGIKRPHWVDCNERRWAEQQHGRSIAIRIRNNRTEWFFQSIRHFIAGQFISEQLGYREPNVTGRWCRRGDFGFSRSGRWNGSFGQYRGWRGHGYLRRNGTTNTPIGNLNQFVLIEHQSVREFDQWVWRGHEFNAYFTKRGQ
jgi:hypothetical protein